VDDDQPRRRRRRRATSPQGAPQAAQSVEPQSVEPQSVEPPPTPAAPGATPPPPSPATRKRRPPRDGTERGLRDLVGAGRSQVGVSGALRARDVNRPTDDDMAEAEREIVIVRRNWKPTDAG
jgi:hypothetical protein